MKKIQVAFKRVFLLEDDPQLQSLFTLFLVKKGFSVNVSDTSEGSLRILSVEKFDLIVLDMPFSLAKGKKITEAIKKTSPNSPIVALITLPLNEELNENILFEEFDVNCFIKKPIDIKKFYSAIENAINNSTMHRH